MSRLPLLHSGFLKRTFASGDAQGSHCKQVPSLWPCTTRKEQDWCCSFPREAVSSPGLAVMPKL